MDVNAAANRRDSFHFLIKSIAFYNNIVCYISLLIYACNIIHYIQEYYGCSDDTYDDCKKVFWELLYIKYTFKELAVRCTLHTIFILLIIAMVYTNMKLLTDPEPEGHSIKFWLILHEVVSYYICICITMILVITLMSEIIEFVAGSVAIVILTMEILMMKRFHKMETFYRLNLLIDHLTKTDPKHLRVIWVPNEKENDITKHEDPSRSLYAQHNI